MDTPPLSPAELRRFGIVTALIVVVLFGLLLPWIFDHRFPIWPWIVAAVLSSAGLLMPGALGPVYRGWMIFGHLLGWVNTRLLLGLVFYAILLPIGLVMRAFGHDPLMSKLEPDATSYRVRSSEETREHFERPF
jgi:hypothetical protein